MTTPALHPTPRWTDVAREQLRATGVAVRREMAVVGALLGAVMVLVLTSHFLGDGTSFDFNLSEMTLPVILLGFFAPMAVWKEEEPSRRSYLWTLPVDRARNTLLKVFGGWVWFMALVGTFLLWAVALALFTGGEIGVEEVQVLLRELPAGVRPTDADSYLHRLVAPAWMWLVPFTAATTTYLLGSIVVLSSDHPWRWFGGAIFTFLLLSALKLAGPIGGIGQALGAVADGPYGAETVFTGVDEEKSTLIVDGRPIEIWLDRPVADRWAAATLLWAGFGLVGVLIAAHRHQER